MTYSYLLRLSVEQNGSVISRRPSRSQSELIRDSGNLRRSPQGNEPRSHHDPESAIRGQTSMHWPNCNRLRGAIMFQRRSRELVRLRTSGAEAYPSASRRCPRSNAPWELAGGKIRLIARCALNHKKHDTLSTLALPLAQWETPRAARGRAGKAARQNNTVAAAAQMEAASKDGCAHLSPPRATAASVVLRENARRSVLLALHCCWRDPTVGFLGAACRSASRSLRLTEAGGAKVRSVFCGGKANESAQDLPRRPIPGRIASGVARRTRSCFRPEVESDQFRHRLENPTRKPGSCSGPIHAFARMADSLVG